MYDANCENVMETQKAWDNSREIIRNENDLINYRMNRFLTFQGFLFAGSSVLISNTFDKEPPIPQLTVAFMVSMGALIGYIMCRRTQIHIEAAARHIEATSEWWTAFREKTEFGEKTRFRKELPFPIIVGTLGEPTLIRCGKHKLTHEKAIKDHYRELLEALEKHYRKSFRERLLFKDKEKKILYPSTIIAASFPRILMWVWGITFAISLGFLGVFFYKHCDNIWQDINTFVSGKKCLQFTYPYNLCYNLCL